jgi:putative ABC transport system permease protein
MASFLLFEPGMRNYLSDLRLAFRALGHRPGATALVVVSLALTLGVCGTAFSVLDALFWRALPVTAPDQLAWVWAVDPQQRPDQLTWIEYRAVALRTAGVAEALAQDRKTVRVQLPDRLDRPLVAGVSNNFFDMLGVTAAAGTVFHRGPAQDEQVVVSDRYWRRALGGDPAIVGGTLQINGRPFRVLGVLPRGFGGPNRGLAVDLFFPEETMFGVLGYGSPLDPRNNDFEVLVRLRPGTDFAAVKRQVDGVLRQVDRDGLAMAPNRTSIVESLQASGLQAGARVGTLFVAILLLVLLVAAANVANMRLAQNEERRGETAIRLALGATGWHIWRQHLTEMAVLGGLGVAGAWLVIAWLVDLAPVLLFGGERFLDFGIRFDARTFAASVAGMLVVTLVGTLIPFRDVARRTLTADLRASAIRLPSRWLSGMVIVQIGFVTAIIVVAGLFVRSLDNVARIRPAMDTDRRIVLVSGYWESGGPPAVRADALASRLGAVPGVVRVAYARRALLSGSGGGAAVPVELPGKGTVQLRFNQVDPNYFATTGARVLRGRRFGRGDGADATPVILVNETFVRRFVTAGQSAVGSWFRVDGKDRQVVGVMEDGPTISLQEAPLPYLYFPFAQKPSSEPTFFVETSGDPAAAVARVRDGARRADPAFAVADVQTMRSLMSSARREHELAVTVTGGLAALCLLLASAGLFGVTMFAVSRRTREFGVRVALGATSTTLGRQVFRETSGRVVRGLAFGWGLAWAAQRLVQQQLYGVSALDPTALLSATAIVIAVALAASLQPALRASRIDPIRALRHE